MRIDEMEAGRELDVLVAETVLEWRLIEDSETTTTYDGRQVSRLFDKVGLPPDVSNDEAIRHSVPRCSASPAKVWQVVEAFIADPDEGWIFKLWYSPTLRLFEASFWRYVHTETGRPQDKTPMTPYEQTKEVVGTSRHKIVQVAICRAALLAKGIVEAEVLL